MISADSLAMATRPPWRITGAQASDRLTRQASSSGGASSRRFMAVSGCQRSSVADTMRGGRPAHSRTARECKKGEGEPAPALAYLDRLGRSPLLHADRLGGLDRLVLRLRLHRPRGA